MRISLAKLMGLILAIAVGLATLSCFGPAPSWPEPSVVGLLSLCAVGACLIQGRLRAALAAGSSAGCLYLALAFGPGLPPSAVDYLPGSCALHALYPGRALSEQALSEAERKEACSCAQCVAPYLDAARNDYYRRGQSLSGLVAALLTGGVVWGVSRRPIKIPGTPARRRAA